MISGEDFFEQVLEHVKPSLLRFIGAKYGRNQLYEAAVLEARLRDEIIILVESDPPTRRSILAIYEERKQVCLVILVLFLPFIRDLCACL